MADSSGKPRVLVLGGCGFIGRHLVTFLVEGKLASLIRVADKVPPAMAWLNPKHRSAFDHPSVEYVSTNLLSAVSRGNAFALEVGNWDFVINLAAETKPNQTEEVYHHGIVPLSLCCAQLAASLKVGRFIELSDGRIKTSPKKAVQESDQVESCSISAKCKLQVEKELAAIEGLDYVVLRPAIVYGIGDRYGLTPWLILGAIYRHLGEPLRLLWHKDVHMNTVHVSDVCHAVWHACTTSSTPADRLYHVADGADTTLGQLAQLTAEIFEIKFNFVGKTLSMLAKVDLEAVVEDANDKHLPPWAELCRLRGIDNTPLCPYATSDNLSGRHLWLDAGRLAADAGVSVVGHARPTTVLLREVVDDYVAMGVFPNLQ